MDLKIKADIEAIELIQNKLKTFQAVKPTPETIPKEGDSVVITELETKDGEDNIQFNPTAKNVQYKVITHANPAKNTAGAKIIATTDLGAGMIQIIEKEIGNPRYPLRSKE